MERSLSSVAENVKYLTDTIGEAAIKSGRRPEDVALMAVTKTVLAQRVNEAIACGVKLLGENRAQELQDKYEDYHKDNVDIHFIGHLQTNKVKQVVGKVSMIQSVDSLKLAKEISRMSVAKDCTTQVLIEVNIGGELSKEGGSPEQTEELARQIAELPGIFLRGLMTIPPICHKTVEIEGYFSQMQALMVDMKAKNIDNSNMDILSMGMSDDYVHAIKHGATIVRLGSAIFGRRLPAV